jgi:serine phosphatase RsbU (regulator of sigma subunit)/putative methionine-R-sulfoxide reductase with GAF domain
MSAVTEGDTAQAFAEVARVLQAQDGAQATLQKVVDLAPGVIEGCDHAGISLVVGQRVHTPAASDEVPATVDRIQYETGQGPCLDAIRHHEVFATDDLAEEARWSAFSARATAETGVRSLLSFRLFTEEDTLGALNLYSRAPSAFTATSRASGAVFAAHAAIALTAAREHDRAQDLATDLAHSEADARAYEEQARLAVMLQRSMLPTLPDLGPVQLAARYVPAVAAAEVGGDWYDAFALPGAVPGGARGGLVPVTGGTALVIGDVAGHDTDAAVGMGQLRNLLRALAVDRVEPAGDLLRRLDRVTTHLGATQTATCIYAALEPSDTRPDRRPDRATGDAATGDAVTGDHREAGWRLRFANAGHPPPLLVTADGAARYLPTPDHLLLGLGLDQERSTTVVDLPAGSMLLLYTDGLVEHRARALQEGLDRLRQLAATLVDRPLDRVCDTLLEELAAQPEDDVCLLAVRIPSAGA